MSKSIEQLARIHDRGEKEWLDTAKRVGLDKGRTLNRTTLLTKHEVQRLVRAMGIAAGGAKEEAVEPQAPSWAPKAHEFEEASDDPVAAGALRSPANYPVFVHLDLLQEDALDASGPTASHEILGHLHKRLAHKIWLAGGRGSPGRSKSTQGDASGWLRTGLGSFKYYLYWAKRGSPATKAISHDLPANALIMRAVRPHDDFSALDAGSREDYVELQRHEASTDSGYLRQPWTPEQIEWANRNETVRILRGTPGSGKTTCLQLATERRPDEKVLYLTFSERLRDRAEEDFGLQGLGANSRVEFRTVTELVERIVGERASDDLTGLAKRIGDLPRDRVSAWRQNADELICELRAHLVGAATPSDLERLEDPNCVKRHHNGTTPAPTIRAPPTPSCRTASARRQRRQVLHAPRTAALSRPPKAPGGEAWTASPSGCSLTLSAPSSQRWADRRGGVRPAQFPASDSAGTTDHRSPDRRRCC